MGGLAPGRYAMSDGTQVDLHANGRIDLAGTPYLAGAASPLPVCVANAVRHAGVTLADAVRMVTANPARLLGLPLAAGRESLRLGATANLTVFSMSDATGAIHVRRTILGGAVVFETL
jgi:N-acetylglucosamine-6-phosphate deacetylase